VDDLGYQAAIVNVLMNSTLRAEIIRGDTSGLLRFGVSSERVKEIAVWLTRWNHQVCSYADDLVSKRARELKGAFPHSYLFLKNDWEQLVRDYIAIPPSSECKIANRASSGRDFGLFLQRTISLGEFHDVVEYELTRLAVGCARVTDLNAALTRVKSVDLQTLVPFLSPLAKLCSINYRLQDLLGWVRTRRSTLARATELMHFLVFRREASGSTIEIIALGRALGAVIARIDGNTSLSQLVEGTPELKCSTNAIGELWKGLAPLAAGRLIGFR
jgi:hypothetical protein